MLPLGYFLVRYNKKRKLESLEGLSIKVEGMTCSHCEANVKRNLEKIKGINRVVANNQNNTVKISGKNFSLTEIKTTLNKLGYKYIG
jgi:copper chaperone CopZ